MGCITSRTGPEIIVSTCHVEESTSTNNAEALMCDSDFRPVQHSTLDYEEKVSLGRSCGELTTPSPSIPISLLPCQSPDQALCLGKTRELDLNAITLSSSSPVSNVCVPECTLSKDSAIHTNPLDVSLNDLVGVVRSTNQQQQPTLEWLQLHHNYELSPAILKDPQQLQQIAYDLSNCGDGMSEHWSTRLSPTMRSETSLHHSVTYFEPNTEIGLARNESLASNLSRLSRQEVDDEEGGGYSRDPSLVRNPTISVIATDSPTESRHSSIDSPVQPEAILALTSTVDRIPSAILHSPSRLNVNEQPHLLQPIMMMDSLRALATPSGDTGEVLN